MSTQPSVIRYQHSVELLVPTKCRCTLPLPEPVRQVVLQEVRRLIARWFGGTTLDADGLAGMRPTVGDYMANDGTMASEACSAVMGSTNSAGLSEYIDAVRRLACDVASRLTQECVLIRVDGVTEICLNPDPYDPATHQCAVRPAGAAPLPQVAPERTEKRNLQQALEGLDGPEALRRLFCGVLGYGHDDEAMPCTGLPEGAPLPRSVAEHNGFRVIWFPLTDERLSVKAERDAVTRMLDDDPTLRALFVFSNRSMDQWRLVNARYVAGDAAKPLLRRMAVACQTGRTAVDRLQAIAIAKIGEAADAAAIQAAHDRAFDVQAVTDGFYKEYEAVFRKVSDLVTGFGEGDEEDAARRLFTQHLFNRLMFVAFIEKKGWLRFGEDRDYLQALRRDYLKRPVPEGFYASRLRLLFFSGLNTPHGADLVGINGGGILTDLIGHVPFLNGGLFAETEAELNRAPGVPDEAVWDILDLYAGYNFTITESTTLDQEVAIDPEMLGTIFERLITDRHGSGSYYTPKPIVSYMCREALVGHLVARTGQTEEAARAFVYDHDPSAIGHIERVLAALSDLRVCDPACGSGAYLLGMLHELLDLRDALFVAHKVGAQEVYDRKLQIIGRNLYGVDLDPTAVNITCLRLWLTLAVEYAAGADETPPPLPNLDFKIRQGNSLTGPDPQAIASGHLALFHGVVEDYARAKAEYLKASEPGPKATAGAAVRAAREQIEAALGGGAASAGLNWFVEFAEVFADGNGGFDIVVANPPYVRQELISDQKPALKAVYGELHCGTADLYTYFYMRGVQVLRTGGVLAYISSNKWFRAAYGAKLRRYIAETCRVGRVTDFGELPVFAAAATFPMIFIASKGSPDGSAIYTQVTTLKPPYPDVAALNTMLGRPLPAGALAGERWTLAGSETADRLRKMDGSGPSLGEYIGGQVYRGVLTGLNAAFVIDGAKRRELVESDPRNDEIIKPLLLGRDIRRWAAENHDRWLITTAIGVDMVRHSAVMAHLCQWEDRLRARQDQGSHWWELRACSYYGLFDQPKILYPEIALEQRFAYDAAGGIYTNNKGFVIPTDDLYLLGVLNSADAWAYTSSCCAVLGDAGKRGRVMLQWVNLQRLPIPEASEADRAAIADLARRCVDARGVECEAWEREINARVEALYGL